MLPFTNHEAGIKAAQELLSGLESFKAVVDRLYTNRAIPGPLYSQLQLYRYDTKLAIEIFSREQERAFKRAGGTFFVQPVETFKGMLHRGREER